MAITFNCRHCGKSLTTTDDKAGRQAKCPGCGELIVVPKSEAVEDSYEEAASDDDGAEMTAPSPATKSCPMCGAENPRRAKVCQACGEEFVGAARQAGSKERTHQIIDAGDVLSATWKIFQQNLSVLVLSTLACVGICLGVYAVFIAVFAAISISLQPQMGRQEAELIINLLSLPLGIGITALVAYLNSGVNRLLLAVARGEEATVNMIFSGGRYAMRSFLVGILFNMMTTFGFYCCIAPGILLWLMFWPFLYIIVDQDSPGLESLTKAKDLTTNNWLSVFVLILAASGIGLVGTVTCVGVVFTMPVTWLSFAVAYCKMTGQRTAE